MKAAQHLPPAIVLSGHTMALGVARSLGSAGVPVVVVHHDPRDMAQFSKYVIETIAAPEPETQSAAFVELLVEISEQLGGGVLFPTSDETVVALSKNRALLAERYLVACPDWAVAELFIDKRFTYQLAHASGVPAPKTLAPRSEREAEEFASRADYPCLVKPSQSHLFYSRFNRKMVPVDDPEELLRVHAAASAEGIDVLLQEIIPGPDENVVNYNAYFAGGGALAEFTSRHIRNAPMLWGSPRVALSESIPDVIGPGRTILEKMGFEGYACTEFKQDPRDGLFKLMEVNGRHNLSTMLAVQCGINFPLLHYRHLVDGTEPKPAGYEKQVYWIDITRDLGYSVRHIRQERYRLKQYVQPYLGKHVFAIFDWKDSRPFIRRSLFLAREALKALASRLRPPDRNAKRPLTSEATI